MFDVFVSYARAGDGGVAKAVRDGLHGFARRPFALRAMRVFLDSAALGVAGDLPGRLRQSLDDSQRLVLLASPAAAASRWVSEEVRHWLSTKGADRIVLVLTDGEIVWDPVADDFDWTRTTALPDALKRAFAREPIWLDMRWGRTAADLSLRNARFRQIVAAISAVVLDRPLDELLGEDVRQQRFLARARAAAIAAIAGLGLAAAAAAWIAIEQRNQARRNAAISATFATASDARSLLARDQTAAIGRVVEAHESALPLGLARTREIDAALAEVDEAARLRRQWPDQFGGAAPVLGELLGISASPDRQRFVLVGRDLVHVVDAQGVAVRPPIHGPGFGPTRASAAAWTPDGSRFALAAAERAADGVLRPAILLFDREGRASAAPLQWPPGADGEAVALAFSSSSESLVAADSNGRVLEFPLAGGAPHVAPAALGPGVNAIVEFADGWLIATGPPRRLPILRGGGAPFRPQMRYWVREKGDFAMATAGAASVMSMATGVRRDRIVTGGYDGVIRVWRESHGDDAIELHHEFAAHLGAVMSVAVAPGGRWIASGGEDGAVRLWAGNGMSPTPPLLGHAAAVTGLAFASDGRTLVSAAMDGTVREWDVADIVGADLQLKVGGPATATGGDGRIAVASGVELHVVQGDTVRSMRWLASRPSRLWTTAVGSAGDARLLLVGQGSLDPADATTNLLHLVQADATVVQLRANPRNAARLIAFSPRLGAFAVAYGKPFGLGRSMAALRGAASPENEAGLLFLGADGEVLAATVDPHDRSAQALAASPAADGPAFAVARGAGTVELLDARGQAIGRPLALRSRGPDPTVTALLYSHDGRTLFAASSGSGFLGVGAVSEVEIHAIDIAAGAHRTIVSAGHRQPVCALALSPDASLLAAAECVQTASERQGESYQVRLWTPSGEPVGRALKGHTAPIRAAAFDADARGRTTLRTVDDSGNLRTWRVGPDAAVARIRDRVSEPALVARSQRALLDARDSIRRDAASGPAIGLLRTSAQLRPGDTAVRRALAEHLLRLGDAAGAERELDGAIEASPHAPMPYHDRARLRLARRDFDGARRDLTAAGERAYMHFRAPVVDGPFAAMMAGIEQAASRLLEDSMLSLVETRALAACHAGDVDAAAADAKTVLARRPGWVAARQVAAATAQTPPAACPAIDLADRFSVMR